ncbi:MAG: type II toxin-antitoxin system prevent-host-death family antitoxin [Firmicutes bacterium]|nr:type II toxin-antitoxin system prevent-host-death family antitoxin [Bacillota bacterium]
MRKVGIREAKARLSELLRDVRQGGEWILTERGKPIARLAPVRRDDLTLADRVRRLEERGLVAPLGHEQRPLPPPLPLESGLATRWLEEERRHGR